MYHANTRLLKAFLLSGWCLGVLACWSGFPAKAAEGDAYAAAAELYAQSNWEAASKAWEGIVRQRPDHPRREDALFYLAESRMQLQQPAAAREDYRALLKHYPRTRHRRTALFRIAEAGVVLGDKAALRDLDAYRREFPTDAWNGRVDAYFGELRLHAGDAVAAEQSFRESLRQFPNGPLDDDCRIGLARALAQQGQREEALRLLEAVAGKPASRVADKAAYYLGQLQLESGDAAAAERTFLALVHDHSQSSFREAATLGHARALMALQSHAEAENELAALLRHECLGVEAHYYLGMARKARRAWAEASQAFLEGAERDAQHPLAPVLLFHAGDAARLAGHHEQADAIFARVIREWPRGAWHDDCLLGQVRIAETTGRHERVDALNAELQRLFPRSQAARQAQRVQVRSLLARARYAEAAALLQEVIEHSPRTDAKLPLDKYHLAAAYLGDGRAEDAIRVVQDTLPAADRELQGELLAIQATALIELDRHEKAIESLREALARLPAGARATTSQAELTLCLLATGQYEQAQAAYERVLVRPGDGLPTQTALLRLADCAYRHGHRQWAVDLYSALAKRDRPPEIAAKALVGLAWCQWESGQRTAAATTCQQVLERYPSEAAAADAAMLRGRILEERGNTAGALELYHVALNVEGSSQAAPALRAAARLHADRDELQEADRLYRRLAAEFPQNPQRLAALYDWAFVLLRQGRDDEAAQCFKEIHERGKECEHWADATFRLAERAAQGKDFDRAATLLAALDQGPLPAELAPYVDCLAGRVAIARGDGAAADQRLERAAATAKDAELVQTIRYWRAENAFRLGRAQQAAEEFAALAATMDDARDAWAPLVLLRQAQANANLQRWREALAVAETIPARFPEFDQLYEADYLRGRCLAALARFGEARLAYDAVLRSPHGGQSETAAMAQWMIGETYFHQRAYHEALRAYLRGVSLFVEFPQWRAAALLQAAKCHEQLGNFKESIVALARIVDEFPQTSYRDEAARRLDAARARRVRTR